MQRITAPEEMTELKELDYGYQFTIMKASLEPYEFERSIFLRYTVQESSSIGG